VTSDGFNCCLAIDERIILRITNQFSAYTEEAVRQITFLTDQYHMDSATTTTTTTTTRMVLERQTDEKFTNDSTINNSQVLDDLNYSLKDIDRDSIKPNCLLKTKLPFEGEVQTSEAFRQPEEWNSDQLDFGKSSATSSHSMNDVPIDVDGLEFIGNKRDMFTCRYKDCFRPLPNYQEYMNHLNQHYLEKPFTCHFKGCSKTFHSNCDLASHVLGHKQETLYKCPVVKCGHTLQTQEKLDHHIALHNAPKPFVCDFNGCEKGFRTKVSLQVHIAEHTGHKPYNCPADV